LELRMLNELPWNAVDLHQSVRIGLSRQRPATHASRTVR
jgi:hypothetical protein